MVSNYKSKIIQVQKPAQSLQAFQKKVATGEDVHVGYLKPMLLAAGIVVVAVAVFFGTRAARASSLEKHQTALADLQLEVVGDLIGGQPAPQDLEQRMRAHLPELEALARTAPGDDRALTQGLLATWQLQLGEKAIVPAPPSDAWGKLRLAQRQLALGQGREAAANIAPLRKSADPDQAWAEIFWTTLLDTDRLQGDREKAWKDLAEYKARYKQQADPGLERLLAGV